jgi:hypothetical protein
VIVRFRPPGACAETSSATSPIAAQIAQPVNIRLLNMRFPPLACAQEGRHSSETGTTSHRRFDQLNISGSNLQ